jgi:hypothetical protein
MGLGTATTLSVYGSVELELDREKADGLAQGDSQVRASTIHSWLINWL